MRLFIRDNWAVLAVFGLLAVGSSLALCRGSAGCFVAADRNGERPQVITANSASKVELESEGEDVPNVYTGGKVEHADEATFDQLVLESDVPVLVDFYADWCGPCQMIAPVLEEVARETPNAEVVKVNVDHSPKLAARYGISSIPSLRVFKNGEVIAQHVGLADKAHLKALFES